MPIDDDLGLSEREKELKKWNAPYRYQEYPRMLYRGVTVGGRLEVEQRIVGEGEHVTATATGWLVHPTQAIDAEERRQEAIGTAAAERAWADRRLSVAAQDDAAAVDATTGRHLGEIPERPRRPRPSRRNAKLKKETEA